MAFESTKADNVKMITHIHHINFLVKNLENAVTQYEKIPGIGPFEFDQLEQRAVRTAKTRLGDAWLVLVQPIDDESIPAKHLKEHGEGFFLLSLGTDNLDKSLEKIQTEQIQLYGTTRTGLDNWQVQDLDPLAFFGTQIQLSEEI